MDKIKKVLALLFEVQEAKKEGKLWYKSATIWANIIAFIALLVQSFAGFIIKPEDQAVLLAVINFGLRLITKSPTGFYKPTDDIKT